MLFSTRLQLWQLIEKGENHLHIAVVHWMLLPLIRPRSFGKKIEYHVNHLFYMLYYLTIV